MTDVAIPPIEAANVHGLRPYPEYKPSGVDWLGDIPTHWDTSRLKYLGMLKSGEGITNTEIEDVGEYPVLGGNGLRGYYSRFTHQGDYVLVGRQGALCGNVHRVSGKFWASEHAIVVTPNPQVDIDWLARSLRAMNLNQYSIAAAQPGLAVERIAQLGCPLPPHDEQAAIADFLDAMDERITRFIDARRRMIALLKEQKQAIINQAVTKGLNLDVPMKPSGFDWLGDIPAHWEMRRLTQIARLESGHTPSRQQPEYWENCTIPWVSLKDVGKLRSDEVTYIHETEELVSELGLANSSARLLPKDTVILSRTASVGYSAILGKPMATTQDFVNWICGPRLSPLFLLKCLRGMRRRFSELMMGSTHQTIYMPDVRAFAIGLPPLAEQLRIVDFLDQQSRKHTFATIKALREIELIKEYRTRLISDVVTGKVNVMDIAFSLRMEKSQEKVQG